MRKQTAGLTEAALERFMTKAKRAAGLRGTVNVLVTTGRELRLLNSRFLGQDKTTDVLSFPPVPGLVTDFAGDVAISADIAAQNARRLGHSTAEEVKLLALHGILHLAGYDHEHDRGQMARKEARLRRQLSLPVGLIGRNTENSEKNISPTKPSKPTRSRTQSLAVRPHARTSRSGRRLR